MALILIVEDDPIIGWCTLRCLVRMGHRTIGPVGTAQEALYQAEENHPDLVIMDIGLDGDVDGIDAAREILDRYGIYSIFVTSEQDEATRARARTSSPLGYLVKPACARNLQSLIDCAMRRSA